MKSKLVLTSRTDAVFLGVCGGLATYFEIDSVYVRIMILALALITGFVPVMIIYLTLGFILPDESWDN